MMNKFFIYVFLVPTFLVAMEQEQREQKKFLGYYYEELEEMYTRAPEKMKILLKKVQDPLYDSTPQIRAAFFIGEPGTDKTTGAVTFAYMLRKTHEREFIDCVDFTQKDRGATTENLKDRIDVLMQSEQNMVVILDEVQELLDHADDPHYDTASTGRYIKKLFNNNRLNPKLFIIATLNNCDSWTNHIKSTLRGRIINFKSISSSEDKIKALKSRLKLKQIACDPAVDIPFLTDIVKEMNGWSGRDFESFADLVADEHLKKNDSLKNCIATQGTLKAALQEMKEDINITSYSQKESDFQQRERQQKESLRANLISQWIHRKQITKNWGTTGISTSETISPSVTQENLNVIWHNAYPREEPLEFPQDTKKTTSQYIIENAALFGVAGALLVDSRGMNLGAAVGGMVGLFLGLQENGLNNCNIQ